MTKKQTPTKRPIHHKVKHRAKLAVLPHSANDFRPHLIRWYGIAAMLIVVVIAFASTHIQQGGVLGVRANITATGLLNDTNAERVKAGAPNLRYDEQLSTAAFYKAQDMLEKQYWAHNSPDGTTPWHWFAKAGYNYSFAGENLAKNFTSTQSTIAAWMASTHHRDNIVNKNYTDVGFAVVDGTLDGKPTTLVVALYGAPATSVAGAAAATFSASSGTLNIISQIGLSLQSMSPAVLGSIVLLFVGAMIALLAHGYRKRMPLALRRSWKYHHGLYKAIGLSALAIVLVTLYSGGQI